MKNVLEEVKSSDLISQNEDSVYLDITAYEYDNTTAYLEVLDDLNEKTIKFIEREVRNSYEYRNFINFLKNDLDLTKCSLLPGIDIKESAVSLEFHHYPMNLYEIVETVSKQRIYALKNDEKVSCLEIAEQVMKEHYLGNVGLVPLTKTLHEMAHTRSIIVPISKVHGNYKRFLKNYSSFIDADIKDRIHEAEIQSDSEDAKLFNQSKLKKTVLKYNVSYISNDEGEEDVK